MSGAVVDGERNDESNGAGIVFAMESRKPRMIGTVVMCR